MDGFGFLDDGSFDSDHMWQERGASSATAELPPGTVDSSDPNYWMPVGFGGEPAEPTPVRSKELTLDRHGNVDTNTFDPEFGWQAEGQAHFRKMKLQALGYEAACCGGCGTGDGCTGDTGNTAPDNMFAVNTIDPGLEHETPDRQVASQLQDTSSIPSDVEDRSELIEWTSLVYQTTEEPTWGGSIGGRRDLFGIVDPWVAVPAPPTCGWEVYCGRIRKLTAKVLGVPVGFCHCWIVVTDCTGTVRRYDVWQEKNLPQVPKEKRIGEHLLQDVTPPGAGPDAAFKGVLKGQRRCGNSYECEQDAQGNWTHPKCKCLKKRIDSYVWRNTYFAAGYNSNSFVKHMIHFCKLKNKIVRGKKKWIKPCNLGSCAYGLPFRLRGWGGQTPPWKYNAEQARRREAARRAAQAAGRSF